MNPPKLARHPFWLKVLLSALLSLASCGVFAECIGVVTAGGGVDFWEHISKGAKQAGKDLNYPVIVRGPVNEDDHVSQGLILDQMIEHGCNAIVLAPNDIKRFEQISALTRKQIPAVIIDRDLGNKHISSVKTDNVEAGKLAARKMIALLNGEGKIAIFRFSPKVSSTSNREQGFLQEIAHSEIEIVMDEYLGTNLSEANEKAFTLLNSQDLDGLFTPNELTTLAALHMRQRLTKPNNLKHIGFDHHKTFIEHIVSGHLNAIVIQNPFQIGYQGVALAYQKLSGADTQSHINTPAFLVDKQNLDSQEIQQILNNRY